MANPPPLTYLLGLQMDAEIQNAVDGGKLTPQAGKALQKLLPGSYCLHKSWGFGRVDSINFLVSQLTVDFHSKKGHSMQLQYAAESLQPIPPGHILALKASDLPGLKAKAKEDPVGMMRTILNSFGGKATQDQVAQSLMPEVFNETEWKRWWDSAKKALKKDGHFALPAKKGEPILLREQAVSRGDELVEQFDNARQLKDQLQALDGIIKNLDSFSDPAPLKPIVVAAEEAARKNLKLRPPLRSSCCWRAMKFAKRRISSPPRAPRRWSRCSATSRRTSSKSCPRSARPSRSASWPRFPRPSATTGRKKRSACCCAARDAWSRRSRG